jgi:5-hydroxyisourate hydrolase
VRVVLERLGGDGAIEEVAFGATDADGRVQELAAAARGLRAGTYRLRFDTGAYFAAGGRETLYPEVAVAVSLAGDGAHYHVPLLVSPFGYTTYRGS